MGNASDMLSGGGAPGLTFPELGSEASGRIVDVAQIQGRNFDDQSKLQWWNRPDGPATGDPADEPKMIFVVTLATSLRDFGPDDDGVRTLWCRSNLHTAVKVAIHKGLKKTRGILDEELIGGKLRVQFYALGDPPKKGAKPPKLFRAEFTPPQASSALDEVSEVNPPADDIGW